VGIGQGEKGKQEFVPIAESLLKLKELWLIFVVRGNAVSKDQKHRIGQRGQKNFEKVKNVVMNSGLNHIEFLRVAGNFVPSNANTGLTPSKIQRLLSFTPWRFGKTSEFITTFIKEMAGMKIQRTLLHYENSFEGEII